MFGLLLGLCIAIIDDMLSVNANRKLKVVLSDSLGDAKAEMGFMVPTGLFATLVCRR